MNYEQEQQFAAEVKRYVTVSYTHLANKSEQSFIRASGEVATSQSFSLVR